MAKLPFTKEEMKLGRLLVDRPDVTVNPRMATLLGRPDKAWDGPTEAAVRAAMRGADNTDTE